MALFCNSVQKEALPVVMWAAALPEAAWRRRWSWPMNPKRAGDRRILFSGPLESKTGALP